MQRGRGRQAPAVAGGRGGAAAAASGRGAGVPLSIVNQLQAAEIPEEVLLCRRYANHGLVSISASFDRDGVVSRTYHVRGADGTIQQMDGPAWTTYIRGREHAAAQAAEAATIAARMVARLGRPPTTAKNAVPNEEQRLLEMSNKQFAAFKAANLAGHGPAIARFRFRGGAWVCVDADPNTGMVAGA